MPQPQNVYDAVAYPGGAIFKSHPDNLAVMGTLYGLEPAPVESCRVLEIACSEGHNLVPMAYTIPGGQFVGVDLAAEPIAAGQRRIERLGLTNVRLMQGDLMDLDESLGTFDYVIAHGLYAWVPAVVREGLMALIKKVLAPQGIGFVSYNALPGGYVRTMSAEMLKFHVAGTGDVAKDVSESMTFLQFILESMSEKHPVRPALERELKQVRSKGPYITFHDEMADGFAPLSYSDFAAHAARHGLEPLCDADFPPQDDPSFNPEISAMVNGLSDDPVRREQTYDFIRMRMFRESLLCHARTERPDIDLKAIERLRLASKTLPVETETPAADAEPGERTFSTAGREFKVKDPAMISVLEELSEAWPKSIAMSDLIEGMEADGFTCDDAFLDALFYLIVSRTVELHAWESPVAAGIPPRPRMSAYCRDAAAHGSKAVSLLHFSVELGDPVLRAFAHLLDGTHGAAALLEELRALKPDVTDEERIKGLRSAMHFFQRMGLFLDSSFVEPGKPDGEAR